MEYHKKEVSNNSSKKKLSFRDILREDVLEGHTPLAKFIDILLLLAILASVVCIILESVPSIHSRYEYVLLFVEWVFTIIFTLEYLIRFVCAKNQVKFIFSFFGIIDLISVLPLYLTLIFGTATILQVVRILRLIRVFSRLLRMSQKMDDLSHSFLHLEHHLDSDEKAILFFRPSRKKKIFKYIFIFLLMSISLFEMTFHNLSNFFVLNIPVFFVISVIIFIISFIYLLKFEHKIWSERYTITSERIFYSSGILNETFRSKSYHYITGVSLDQSFTEILINVGNITIHVAGAEKEDFVIKGVSNPIKIKKIINDCISEYHERQAALQRQHTFHDHGLNNVLQNSSNETHQNNNQNIQHHNVSHSNHNIN
jgi:membrane protein YdbS with pleckstrin-like domain